MARILLDSIEQCHIILDISISKRFNPADAMLLFPFSESPDNVYAGIVLSHHVTEPLRRRNMQSWQTAVYGETRLLEHSLLLPQ